MLDLRERQLLLENPLVRCVLAIAKREHLTIDQAAERTLADWPSHDVSDDELLAAERALNAVVARLPAETVKALFADAHEYEVKTLKDHFVSVMHELEGASRASPELRRLGVPTLRAWHWERALVVWRRFMASGRRDHDALVQEPVYWRPDVEAKPFWSLDELPPQFRALEAAAPAIQAELEAVRRDGGWLPYRGVGMQDVQQPADGEDGSAWNALFFYHPFKGRFDANHARCPATSKAIESLPGLCRRELVLFSALTPGSVIPPHNGPFNGRLRVHLALTGSKGCYLRVGTQMREWEDGKVLVFDDSFEHQVCHAGTQTRVVLMMNVVQPGLEARATGLETIARVNPVKYAESDEDRAAREELANKPWWR